MSTINILGIDIGKSIFHLVGHDSSGREVCRKKLNRPKILALLLKTIPGVGDLTASYSIMSTILFKAALDVIITGIQDK